MVGGIVCIKHCIAQLLRNDRKPNIKFMELDTQEYLINVKSPNGFRHKYDSTITHHAKNKVRYLKDEKDKTGYSPSNLALLLGTTIERKKK